MLLNPFSVTLFYVAVLQGVVDNHTENCLYSGFFWPVFSCSWAKYEEIVCISLCIQLKCGKIWTRNIPNMDTFHTVTLYEKLVQLGNLCLFTTLCLTDLSFNQFFPISMTCANGPYWWFIITWTHFVSTWKPKLTRDAKGNSDITKMSRLIQMDT